MSDAKYLTIERLYSMLDSKSFREYSLRKLEQHEQTKKEETEKLNNQLKAALERKTTPINPNESKPKLSLKRSK
jgi:hypothetical protein